MLYSIWLYKSHALFVLPVQPSLVMRANHACMNENVLQAMRGAPFYEQKELRSNGEHVSAVLRMARAELCRRERGIGQGC